MPELSSHTVNGNFQPLVAVKSGVSQASFVVRYLQALETRDFSRARSWLAPDFTISMPGGVILGRLEDLAIWAQARFLQVTKTYEGYTMDGEIVYFHGTLSGLWLDGERFEGLGFIDRFKIDEGRILKQYVWHDLEKIRI